MAQLAPLPDLARCAVHTMTTKPWSLETACAAYAAAGIGAVTVWRQHLPGGSAGSAATIVARHGLTVAALCRGGFFPAIDLARRRAAIDDNRRAIDEAAALGAPMLVLVCGAVPGMPLTTARAQISEGIAAVLPYAKAAGVRLSIEPLHPLYAADRSAVSTMAQARRIADAFPDELPGVSASSCDRRVVGIAVDVYHVWWDDALESEIARAGEHGMLHGFHVCDWKAQQSDMLNDRGLMGEGCIPIRSIRAAVERAGFRGFHEVEIFSAKYWAGDQQAWLDQVVRAYREHV